MQVGVSVVLVQIPLGIEGNTGVSRAGMSMLVMQSLLGTLVYASGAASVFVNCNML